MYTRVIAPRAPLAAVPAVLGLLLILIGTASLHGAPATAPAEPAFKAGRLDAPAIAESSGLVASRAHRGVFWTHNDSGNDPDLFAIDATGKLLASYRVQAENVDWEDIAIDDAGTLYLADIGNNQRNRKEVVVHAIAEPNPNDRPAAAKPAALRVRQSWRLRFPGDKPFDAEALVVVGGKGYLVAKHLNFANAGLYRFDLKAPGPVQVMETVGELPIRFPVTAADVSPDGRRLAVLTVAGPYLFEIAGDVAAATKVEPKRVGFVSPKMEACALTADGLLTTTEDRDVYLFRWKDFGIEAPE